ncbi:MAG: hypothetical protein N2491_11725 [Negativicutes bacterium]|nr:hypothetical protein [Negativicutes bacterium]
MDKLERMLRGLFLDKLPPLAPSVKDSMVRVLPWLFMIFGLLGLFALISAYISFSFANMLAMGMGQVWGTTIPVVGFAMIYLITPVTQILSIAGGYLMKKRLAKGWKLALAATLLSLLAHFLYLSFLGICLDLVFLYILMQIRERYA